MNVHSRFMFERDWDVSLTLVTAVPIETGIGSSTQLLFEIASHLSSANTANLSFYLGLLFTFSLRRPSSCRPSP